MAANRVRRLGAGLLGTLGVLLILAALLLGYATRSLFNENAFASRVAASLEDPRVANFVAEQLADAVIRAKPDLVGLRPVLVGVARSVVTTPPFRAAVRRSARLVHHAVLSGTGKEILLSVQDLDVLLQSMAQARPDLAEKIPARWTAALGELDSLPGGERTIRLARFANRLRAGTYGLLLLGLLLCVASASLTSHRRLAIVRIGLALAVVGVVLAIAARFGGDLIGLFARYRQNSPALTGIGAAFLGGLMAWAIGLSLAGLVLAAASASLLERVVLRRMGLHAQRWFTGPQPLMRLRLSRGLALTAIGGSLLAWPIPALTVAAWLAGLLVGFSGLREAFVAALHLLPQLERSAPAAPRKPRGNAIALVVSMAVVLLAAAAWWLTRATSTVPDHVVVAACNGSPALCDRRLDQVVFPTSHNSMGGADVPGWMFPNQNAGIPKQLADGVRGFLIDAHYGVPVGDKVKTELEDEHAAMAKYNAALGKAGMDAVLRIRDRIAGSAHGPRDVYMCHGFCELGALKLVPVLKEVRSFLVENPGEVLIIVIQDEGVEPQDIARCFKESGLIEFVYRGPARPPWPTLRQMVETDQRVLVMAENDTTGVAWYHPAFAVMQETPYVFQDPSEFSNRPNRGGTRGSLMLMNHWIESVPSPKPSDAAIVNSRDVLMKRIRAFRRARGRLPNLVAVDFYATGDLLAVVRELNAEPWTVTRPARPPAP
jgi:hypothetical protein